MLKSVIIVAILAVFVTANVLPRYGDVQCDLCKSAVKLLEGQIEKNTTVEQIVKTVEELCTYVPTNLEKECDALIEQYAPQLILALIQKASPVEVCQAIQLCPATVRAH